MSLTSLGVGQANKQADTKALMRIVPWGEDPAVLPVEEAFRPVQIPKALLVGPFLALGPGMIAFAAALSWEGIVKGISDDSLPLTQRAFLLLPVALAVVATAVLAALLFVKKPSTPATQQDFLDAYRAARMGTRPIPVRATKIWTNVAEGSLLIYVALLPLPSGPLLVRHTTGGAQPFEAPTYDATFYVWQLRDGWTVVQVAKRTAPSRR